MFTPVSICLKDNLFSHVAPSQDRDNGGGRSLGALQDVQGPGQAVTGPVLSLLSSFRLFSTMCHLYCSKGNITRT